MKDDKGEAGPGADVEKFPAALKKEYNVELLCSAGARGAAGLPPCATPSDPSCVVPAIA